MYLINSTLTVNWYILTGANPPALTDLDIRITDPDGVATYNDNAITIGNYIPSTSTTKGVVSYDFTPNKNGLWKVSLTAGTSAGSTEYYTHEIVVLTNDTYTKKFVKGSLL